MADRYHIEYRPSGKHEPNPYSLHSTCRHCGHTQLDGEDETPCPSRWERRLVTAWEPAPERGQ